MFENATSMHAQYNVGLRNKAILTGKCINIVNLNEFSDYCLSQDFLYEQTDFLVMPSKKSLMLML